MTEKEQNHNIEETAVSIMEQGTVPTDEQLKQLKEDKGTREACMQIQAAATAVRKQQETIDVDGRLQDFHQHNDNADENDTSARRAKILRITMRTVVAMAAVLAGLLIVFNWQKDTLSGDAHQSDAEMAAVYTKDEIQQDIALTKDNGEEVQLGNIDTIKETISFKADSTILDVVPEETLTLSVPSGKSLVVELPDGSKAYLHPGSRLKFPVKFIGNTREVELRGEAYFVVSKDERHPFIVFADKMQVTVLGTEFNVAAYGRGMSNVTLVKGSVKVASSATGQHANSEVILKPGQQALLTGQNASFSVAKVDVNEFTNWRDGYFYFDNMPIKDILLAIGRNYNIDVVCDSPEVLTERMRFIAERGSDLNVILNRLNAIGKIKATKTEGKIIVK